MRDLHIITHFLTAKYRAEEDIMKVSQVEGGTRSEDWLGRGDDKTAAI